LKLTIRISRNSADSQFSEMRHNLGAPKAETKITSIAPNRKQQAKRGLTQSSCQHGQSYIFLIDRKHYGRIQGMREYSFQ
jgi:hypothetical protein